MAGSISKVNTGTVTSSTSIVTSWASGSATAGRQLQLITQMSNVISATPAGWTRQATQINNADFGVFTRTADGTATDTPTLTMSGSGGGVWALREISGVSGIDVVGTAGNGTSNSSSSGAVAATPSAGPRFATYIDASQQGNAFSWTSPAASWSAVTAGTPVDDGNTVSRNGAGGVNDAERISVGTLSATMTAVSQSSTASGVDSSQHSWQVIIYVESGGGSSNPKTVSVASTTATTIKKAVGKLLSIASTTAVTVKKAVGKAIAIGSTTAVTVTALKVKLQSIAPAATTTVSMLRQVGKIVAPLSTTAVSLVKQVGKKVAPTATSTVTVVKRAGKAIAIGATTAVTVGATFVPAGVSNPKTVSIGATTSVTVQAIFIPAPAQQADTGGELDVHPDRARKAARRAADHWARRLTETTDERTRRRRLVELAFEAAAEDRPDLAQEIEQPATRAAAEAAGGLLADLALQLLLTQLGHQAGSALAFPVMDIRAALIRDAAQRSAEARQQREDEDLALLLMSI